jgi:hypothetical protein
LSRDYFELPEGQDRSVTAGFISRIRELVKKVSLAGDEYHIFAHQYAARKIHPVALKRCAYPKKSRAEFETLPSIAVGMN